MSKLHLCDLEDLIPEEPLLMEIEGLELAVIRKGDEVFVIDNQCSHGPGSLSEGELDGYTIICDFHEGGFDIRTGEPVIPPCMVPVRTYEVENNAGKIMIVREAVAVTCAHKLSSC